MKKTTQTKSTVHSTPSHEKRANWELPKLRSEELRLRRILLTDKATSEMLTTHALIGYEIRDLERFQQVHKAPPGSGVNAQ